MPWSRKKSCERCRASKARCNRASPICSRCSERQLQCVYDRQDSAVPSSYSPTTAPGPSVLDASTETRSWAGISSELELGSEDAPLAGQDLDLIADGMLPDFAQELRLDWTTTNALDIGNLSTARVFECSGSEVRQEIMTQRDGFSSYPTLPTISTCISPGSAAGFSPFLFQLPGSSNEPIPDRHSNQVTVTIEKSKDRRTLMRRGAHQSCPLTSIVLGQILSYAEMMVEGDQLPLFIHPPCHIDEELAQDCLESGKHRCLPKDLAICSSLVQMFYQRTTADVSFVWKLIYEEAERLHKEYHTFTSQERLSALQSATIFLILQAKDSDSATKNNVGSLLSIVTEMIVDLTMNYEWHSDIPPERPNRREWVFRESLRRILMVLSIIDLLLEGIIIVTGSSCYDFGAVPLPANRVLWGARTNRGWRTAYASYISSRKTNKVLTVGDLIESDEAGCFTNSANNIRNTEVYPDVLKWCEGLDALGTLIWMVMPFEQYRRRNQV